MGKQLYIGLAVEGSTDMQFLNSVVRRTFQRIAFEECPQEIDVDVFEIDVSKVGKSFREFVADASREGVEKYGILVLAVHADSDKDTLQERIADKFTPAIEYLEELDEGNYCKVITPIIPIKMMEAWMMADTALLKEEIGTSLPDSSLGLHRFPETIADPKNSIENAIRIVMESLPKKRRNLSISDLYSIIGNKVSLVSLSRLPSFCAFKEAIRDSLREIHYLV